MKKKYPNILLVAGSGRKSGKTSLICKLVRALSGLYDITAIKLTPHVHTGTAEGIDNLIYSGEGYRIYSETKSSPKDSGRFVEAGACNVYYIESGRDSINESFRKTMSLIPNNSLVVCESGGLVDHIVPGIFCYVVGASIKDAEINNDRMEKADILFYSSDETKQFDVSAIKVLNSKWSLNKN